MKTTCLLLPVIFIATAVNAQQRAQSVVFNEDTHRMSIAHEPQKISIKPNFGRGEKKGEERTTTAGGRWYNYGDYLGANSTVNFAANYLWNDTTSLDAYSSSVGTGTEYQFNNIVSVGLVCDPFYFGWNDESTYPGMMKVTPSDAYTIDSVFISGVYYRNNARTAPVDTLTVAVIYGDGSNASDLHYKAIDTTGGRAWIYNEFNVDSLYYMNMHHDSVNNQADTFAGGFAPVIKKIYLTNTDTSGEYQAVIPVSISVPAGGMPAVSVSFKSGDPSFTFGDTVFQSDGANVKYKYGMFRPILAYEGTSATPVFPVNSSYDMNEGQFRDEGYDRLANGLYRPQWFWYNASTGGASTYQYPYFGFHLSCATCSSLGVDKLQENTTIANVFPNPANNEVAVSFHLASASDVQVIITDMLGRQVAAEKVGNTANGKAIFNTSGLPGGMYIYTLNANSGHTSGRFVVAH